MGAEFLVVGVLALTLGAVISYKFRDRIERRFNKVEREKTRVINNPELLLEKLNANGKMIDMGEELVFSVGAENTLVLDKIKILKK